MTNIDYKAEVKKIEVNAKHFFEPQFEIQHEIWVWNGERIIVIGESNISESEAWFNAYENLKKDGKIL
jgi:hypothetical protein